MKNFNLGDQVIVDDYWVGTVVGFKDNLYIAVEDQNEDVFDVEVDRVYFDADSR